MFSEKKTNTELESETIEEFISLMGALGLSQWQRADNDGVQEIGWEWGREREKESDVIFKTKHSSRSKGYWTGEVRERHVLVNQSINERTNDRSSTSLSSWKIISERGSSEQMGFHRRLSFHSHEHALYIGRVIINLWSIFFLLDGIYIRAHIYISDSSSLTAIIRTPRIDGWASYRWHNFCLVNISWLSI